MLASASPRRRDLLAQIGLTPDRTRPADLDETPRAGELPAPHAERLAREKAVTIAALEPGAYVLAGDTVVACGRRILPKTERPDEARDCLSLLSGRRHRVHTGLAVVAPDERLAVRVVTSIVTMKRLSAEDIEGYIACGEWEGKAGGYALQGRAAAFIRHMSGSPSAVIGLPLYETAQMLHGLGYCGNAGP